MQEFIGLAYFARYPAVIFDIQRGGPSDRHADAHAAVGHRDLRLRLHGDTKHVLLLPADPHECFEFAGLSFDLADRLQTPIFVMLDLDIGMNEWLSAPFAVGRLARLDRGKVMGFDDLEAGRAFGRYLDVDDDGIAYRTYPGTHPTRGAFFTRGSSKDADAPLHRGGSAYVENMQRLQKKFRTARNLLPAPVLGRTHKSARFGVIYYGSTAPAMEEALERSRTTARCSTSCACAPSPSTTTVAAFIARYDKVFVVEQNRDGQMRMLLVNECNVDPTSSFPFSLRRHAHHRRFIIREIAAGWPALTSDPFRKVIA
jgi:2-oxoglutarate ferredoxin oxidoreductase subunit alpha